MPLNRVMIIGNLGQDPSVMMTPQGKKVAKFSVGVSEKFTDRNGLTQQKTEWFNVVLWDGNNGNGVASIAEKWLKKGSPVYIEGKLQTRSWDDPNGVKRYMTELIGNNIQLLGTQKKETTETPAPADNFDSCGVDDDIPF